jgi:uroporphyrinogen decarboxylase
MNKRDTLLSLVDGRAPANYVPAAFFMHFDPAYHQGQAAIDKHLEYFRYTGMDFVKIQYEQGVPPSPPISKAEDWLKAPRCSEAFFEPSIRLVEGLVKAAKTEALVIMTLYSPLMWAANLAQGADLAGQFRENPQAVAKGLEIMTENVLNLVRAASGQAWTAFTLPLKAARLFAFPAPISSRNTSNLPTWRSGMKSSPACLTSCTSVTMRASMTT